MFLKVFDKFVRRAVPTVPAEPNDAHALVHAALRTAYAMVDGGADVLAKDAYVVLDALYKTRIKINKPLLKEQIQTLRYMVEKIDETYAQSV